MTIRETFAANMRKYRKAAKLTQEQLAERAGLHRTYIGGIEQQRINVSLNNVEKIARALDVDPALFFMASTKPALMGGPAASSASPSQTGKASRKSARSRTKPDHSLMTRADYALCTWTDEGIELRTLDVQDESLSIHILTSLIKQGVEDTDELIEEYDRTQAMILDFYDQQKIRL